MALIDTVAIFLVNLVIGGIGIFAGASIVTGESDLGYAVVTALIGAIVWSVFSYFLGGLAFIGSLITLIAWVWVIKSRYQGGWLNAVFIGFFAWVAVVITLLLLSWAGITGFTAIGVPL